MIINHLSSLEDLNNVSINNIVSSNSSRLIQFDANCAHIINNNLYADFRRALDSGTSSEYIQNINVSLTDGSIVSTMELYAPLSDNTTYYLYPYSLKEFILEFFSSVVPTLTDFIIDLMKSTGRINQIGGGAGKAIIFKDQPFTEAHFTSVPPPLDITHLTSQLLGNINLLSQYLSNVPFLMEIINKKDQEIQALHQEISNLKNNINYAYQTTWR